MMGEPNDDMAARRQRLEKLSHVLDGLFRLPGTDWRFGLDGIVGLIPGVGDTATGVIGSYLIAEAVQIGARKRVIAKMLVNIVVDWLIGLIPLAGDLLDFAFKAHRKNLALLLAEMDRIEFPNLYED